MEIPSIPQRHPLEASRKMLKKGVAVPYILPLPTEETNWKVGYATPSDITLVGSWPNKMSVKPKDDLKYGVDLAVEMPDVSVVYSIEDLLVIHHGTLYLWQDLFQEKDYLNGRFFQKRAFYLSTIAAAIKFSKKNLNVDLLYESPSGDPRLTNLVLVPRKGALTLSLFAFQNLTNILTPRQFSFGFHEIKCKSCHHTYCIPNVPDTTQSSIAVTFQSPSRFFLLKR
jgi:U3 small nucleolar RNA-associated protein 22